jgi:hypothetical protein
LDREKLERASLAARRLAECYSLERNWEEMKNILNGASSGEEKVGEVTAL